MYYFFFFQAEDGKRVKQVTGVQTCALPISGTSTGQRKRGPTGFQASFQETKLEPGRANALKQISWRRRVTRHGCRGTEQNSGNSSHQGADDRLSLPSPQREQTSKPNRIGVFERCDIAVPFGQYRLSRRSPIMATSTQGLVLGRGPLAFSSWSVLSLAGDRVVDW